MKTFFKLTLLISLLILTHHLNAQTRTTYIGGKVGPGGTKDTLVLVLHGPYFYRGVPELGAIQELTTTPDANGEFRFRLPDSRSPFHFSLFLTNQRNKLNGQLADAGDIQDYLAEPGDSLHLDFNPSVPSARGKGSELFNAQQAAGRLAPVDAYGNQPPDLDNYLQHDPARWLRQKDSLLQAQLNVLQTFEPRLSPLAYRIVRADLIGANRWLVYLSIGSTRPFIATGVNLPADLEALYQDLTNRPALVDPREPAALSPKYVEYLYRKLVIEHKHQQPDQADPDYFSAITTTYSGVLRDKLLVRWLTKATSANRLRPAYLASALDAIKDPIFKTMAEQLKATHDKGRPVVDLDFKDAAGRTRHLAELRGKVLFIDLWFSGCGGCVSVAQGLPRVEQAFKGRTDMAFVSISIDKQKALWLNSIRPHPKGQSYTHYTTATTNYWYTGGTGSANSFIKTYVPEGSYPAMLIIDKNGRLFSADPSRPVDPAGRDKLIAELQTALALP